MRLLITQLFQETLNSLINLTEANKKRWLFWPFENRFRAWSFKPAWLRLITVLTLSYWGLILLKLRTVGLKLVEFTEHCVHWISCLEWPSQHTERLYLFLPRRSDHNVAFISHLCNYPLKIAMGYVQIKHQRRRRAVLRASLFGRLASHTNDQAPGKRKLPQLSASLSLRWREKVNRGGEGPGRLSIYLQRNFICSWEAQRSKF